MDLKKWHLVRHLSALSIFILGEYAIFTNEVVWLLPVFAGLTVHLYDSFLVLRHSLRDR